MVLGCVEAVMRGRVYARLVVTTVIISEYGEEEERGKGEGKRRREGRRDK